MKKLLLATAGAITFIASAQAADMPVKAPPPAAVVIYNWTGCYLGGNVGVASARLHNDQTITNGAAGYFAPAVLAEVASRVTGSDRECGLTAGGQIGCNYQTGRVVWGIETDLNWLSADPALGGRFLYSTNGAPYFNNASLETRWLWTLRGRLGFTVTDRVLFYGTGGVAVARVGYNQNFTEPPFTVAPLGTPASVSVNTRAGWTAGVGVEAALAGNWTWKIEYLHTQFRLDANSVVTGAGAGGAGSTATFRNNARVDIDTVRFGLNYRFGGLGIAP